MILGSTDLPPVPSPHLRWNSRPAASVSGTERWSRASRRLVHSLTDEEGHDVPIRGEVLLLLFPPQIDNLWRTQDEALGNFVVGRGQSVEQAVDDWKRRLLANMHRYMEMRPFEMTKEDKELWAKILAIVDVRRYKASKPIVFRQVGRVTKKSTGNAKVEWEDGNVEAVDSNVFDEIFERFKVGQPFEATVTRHPTTFKLIRADAVRRLSGQIENFREKSESLWNKLVGVNRPTDSTHEDSTAVDEDFWLSPPQDEG